MVEKVVDDAGPPAVTVDAVEDIACSFDRQCGDFRTFATWGNGPDTGSDTEARCFGLAQFKHHGIDLIGTYSFGVENGFGVVEDDEHILGGKEGS